MSDAPFFSTFVLSLRDGETPGPLQAVHSFINSSLFSLLCFPLRVFFFCWMMAFLLGNRSFLLLFRVSSG